MRNPTQHNPEDAQTNETVPTEVVQLFESNSSTLDSDDANLVQQILPGMVDDDNQPLPENIPTPAEEGQDAPRFFSTWDHSGDCYRCLAGGRKHKARLSLYTDVKPTIQQLFKMFFFKQYVEGIIIPQTNIHLQKEKHHPVSYGEFLHWLGFWFLMSTINSPDCPDFWSMGEVDCFIGAPQHKCNTCKKGYVPIAYAPQESTSVQNVLVIILHVLKTIFQHQAEFSCSKPKKLHANDHQ